MAAQVILIDYFSGIVYFFENYYNIGEIVKINDVTGKIIFANIKRIGIESFTGEQHFILHSQIKHIVNYSKSSNKIFVTIDINYHNDIRKCLVLLQNYLNDIWTENPFIKAAPIVNGVTQFNRSNIKIEIETLVEKETQWKVEKWLKLNIIEILKKNEIKTV